MNEIKKYNISSKLRFYLLFKGILNPKKMYLFIKNMKKYKKINTFTSFTPSIKTLYPCLNDREDNAGNLGSYFWQDLWASQKIYADNPKAHLDIGSRIDGFIAHLLTFRKVTLIDIRPLESRIPGLSFIQADATNLDTLNDNSVESLSSLCALEHFGLGRYGDPINPNASFEAFHAIDRVIKPLGKAYISVPIGKESLSYNAHRIFNPTTVIENFPHMKLIEFSVINPSTDTIEYNVDIHKYDDTENDSGNLFGLFYFEKSNEPR